MIPCWRLPTAICILSAGVCGAQGPVTAVGNTGPDAKSPPQITAPVAYPTGSESPLGAQIGDLLSGPTVARAHWGIAVSTLDGTPVYGFDEGKLFRPASTAKLFTTAAAMALLGPDSRFNTTVYGKLDAATGIVKGDLVLVGGGDASFGTDILFNPGDADRSPSTGDLRDLTDLTEQLAAKGVRRVTGKIVGDDELFLREPPPQGWAAEDLLWGYGALPSALSIGDNQLRLTISPSPGKTRTGRQAAALVQVSQLVPYLQVTDKIVTRRPGNAEQSDRVDVQVDPVRPLELRVFGTITSGAKPLLEHVAVSDPALYSAEAFRFMLLQRGIRVAGSSAARHSTTAEAQSFLTDLRAPEACQTSTVHGASCAVDCLLFGHSDQVLAQHTSAPLAEDVRFTLKTSANLHAEMMLHQLGARATCAGASTLSGARRLRAWLLQAGLPENEFILYDGSGLSTKDLVTPRAEAQLLAYATTQPWFAVWKAALPVGGVDGTLAGRFANSPIKAKIFAKTGTLGESRALAGYVQCASGRELIFSILVDNHDPGSNTDRGVMDKIVEAIAALN